MYEVSNSRLNFELKHIANDNDIMREMKPKKIVILVISSSESQL